MAERRPNFKLNTESAEKIIGLLGENWDPNSKQATPSEICQEMNIDRRTFNSVVSKAIFTRHPSPAQKLLREHIMHTLHTEWYNEQE